ncbi:MAG: pyridoxamine 5'-phosphate oxidase family protein [Gammaproteobacteria bacterium]
MSKAYPWVPPPHPDAKLPREQLENRIHELLTSVNTCTLATISKEGLPVASPIEYATDKFDMYMLPDAGSPKLKAMERDSHVSLAVHKNHNSWAHARGLQYFANAEIFAPETPGWHAGMEICHWRVWAEEMEWSLDKPPPLPIVKVVPYRILYTETWLWNEGFAAKQTWLAEE